MARKKKNPVLEVTNLGPIKKAKVEFGDLTVLVGPQASGKSIFLQTLNVLVDAKSIAQKLSEQGYHWNGIGAKLIDVFYGEGLENVWSRETKVKWKGKEITKDFANSEKQKTAALPNLLYVPAHRVLSFKNGWPRNFNDFSPNDPFVVKDFSETLRRLLEANLLTPRNTPTIIHASLGLLSEQVYGDYSITLNQSQGRLRLGLERGNEKAIPFMGWSAGQREVSPLLLSLEYLEKPLKYIRRPGGLKWIVLEEPEMGLHPRAISAFLFMALELVSKGFRVCIATHSAHVLDLVWALRVFIEKGASPEFLLRLFGVELNAENRKLATEIMAKTLKVYYFDRDAKEVEDISELDFDSKRNAENTWGGLVDFSSRASDLVAEAVAGHQLQKNENGKKAHV